LDTSLVDLASVAAVFRRDDHDFSSHLAIAQQLIEVLPVPVFFKARDGTYLGVNRAWEDFFGVSRAEMIGRQARDQLYSNTPEVAARHRSMDQILWRDRGTQSYEIALTLPSGEVRHTVFYKATLTEITGRVAGLVGTIIDVTDRKRGEQREAIELAVEHFLGGVDDLHEAIRGILRVMCERLEWVCAARWSLDERDNKLRIVERWAIDDADVRGFQEACERQVFTPDAQGLIRRVLGTGQSTWMRDVTQHSGFLRTKHALKAGLRGAFAFPVVVGDRVLGAIEFFAREPRPPDAWLMQVAVNIGRLIGQLMARREAEEATRASEARFRSLTEMSSDWYWEQDADLRFTHVSGGILRALNLDPSLFIGKRRWDIEMASISPEALAAHVADVDKRLPFSELEYARRDPQGRLHYVSVSGQPIFEQGRFTGYRGVGRDVTRRKSDEKALLESHAALERQANFDDLTGLPNRHLLNDRLKQAMYAQRLQRSVAVVFLDLDHFKVINDSLGHNFGDEVLREVGERLQGAVREGDTVARVGGDEFVLLLADQSREDLIFRSMRRIIQKVGEPMTVGGRDIHITCSAGISLYPQDGPDVQSLLKFADAAMYRAKSHGRNTFEFFTPEMNEIANERLSMEQSLRRALEKDELIVQYQPRIDLRTGKVAAVEALVRWQHPDRGIVLPDRFIALAEETGLIVPIGEWVLRNACMQLSRWLREGAPRIGMSVNLSARQLWTPGLVRTVSEVLRETGTAGLIELELTESMVMHDAESVIATLEELQALGVKASLDDFGTGYSSLSYLRRLPISALKIDGSFVRDIADGHDSGGDHGLLANVIISLAHSLQLSVVAEGVETAEQRDFLARAGCDQAQGYFYAKPLSAEDLVKLLT
jgi:diguanylate cyclase (GGDEF)-like protein/PAS domain S-box-containing protein